MITLVLPGGQTQRLTLDSQSNDVNLDAHARLKPGSYTLRWQALSTDGHITRGEIPFSVH
jgi:copper resistance protein C